MTIEKSGPKRKATHVEVPDLGKDAAERKRALNVLAQRRYRQRRKEHVKRLEDHIAHHVPSPPLGGQEESPIPPYPIILPDVHNVTESFQPFDILNDGSPSSSISPEANVETTLELDGAGGQIQDSPSEWELGTLEADLSLDAALSWDSSTLLSQLMLTPPSSAEDSSSNHDMSSTMTSPRFTGSVAHGTATSLSDPLSYQFDFPDEANLRMLELDLLRAGVAIAKRMHIDDILWQMEAISPYTDPAMKNLSFAHLPMNLWPTKAQQTIQHHPFLDLLPWPTVRNKLLAVFSQPPEIRPPVAASETAILELVYDIEDSAEGVRVWGDDPCSGENWEVGQKVFERWWWAFDRDVVRRSNELRRARGAPALRGGFIVGEVA